MIYFTKERIEKIKEGKITAFVEVIDPQPRHTPACMFTNDLQWFHEWGMSSTISNKPNGPEDYVDYASYGQVGDYLHIYGVTLKITDLKVVNAEKMSGRDIAAVLGCTYEQWWSADWGADYSAMRCNETDFLFLYTFEYIETPPIDEMIKLASACKAIAGVV